MNMLKGNKIYLLLVFVPIAVLAEMLEFGAVTVFTMCCIAILPLAGLLGDATEQLAFHTNPILGGLLNATFGNATELIVCYFALEKGLLRVVQVSLLGSILSNALLVLGMACLVGGLKAVQVKFNIVAAGSNASLLTVAMLSLSVPVVLKEMGQIEPESNEDLMLSRIISTFMLFTYVCYVLFQLVTHRVLFEEKNEDEEEEEEEKEEVLLSLNGSLVVLAISTVLIAFLSEGLTAAIDGAAEGWGISETFVGFVVVPIIGNAAEHSTAVVMAYKGKMDLAFGVALGSSTQIALFVIPTMTLIAAPMHQPLSLIFGVFETVVTFVSVLILGMIIQDGETNWLEGIMLLMAYFIIATAFWFYHE